MKFTIVILFEFPTCEMCSNPEAHLTTVRYVWDRGEGVVMERVGGE